MNSRLVEAQRVKNIAKSTHPSGILLNATFRTSYRSTYEKNIRYFSVEDIPLSILKWRTRFYLYSIKKVKQ